MQTVNAEQAEHWSGKSGDVWVREQAMFDALLAPALDLLLKTASLEPDNRVVDIGCGTGESLLAAANRVGETGQVTGVDVSTPMLSFAQERVDAAGLKNVTCILSDAQVHDFAGTKADHVISRFGVMFFEDPYAAFANLLSALKPGGKMTFVCWAGMDGNPWFRIPAQAAMSVVGAPPAPNPRAPGPMAFSETDYVSDILTKAGAVDVSIVTHDIVLTPLGDLEKNAAFSSKEGPAGRIVKDRNGTPEDFEAVAEKLRVDLAQFETRDGTLRVPGLIHVVSGFATG